MGVNVTYPYSFGSGMTRKVLLIRRGNSDRVCPMTVVSNQAIDEKELNSLTEYNTAQRMPSITRSHVNKQKDALRNADKYVSALFPACVGMYAAVGIAVTAPPLYCNIKNAFSISCSTHIRLI